MDATSGREDVEIVLDRAALEGVIFAGTARNGLTGKPLVEFTVTPMRHAEDGSSTGRGRIGGQEKPGAFRLSGFDPGRYELKIQAPGFAPWSSGVDELRAGERRFDAVLWPSCVIQVAVVDERGRGLDASLVFHDLDGRRLWVDHGTWTANSVRVSENPTVVGGLPRSVVRASVEAAEHQPRTFDLDLSMPPGEPVVLTLSSDAGFERASCQLVLLVTDDPALAATTDLATLRTALTEGRAALLDAPARIDFLDDRGATVAEAVIERDEQDQLTHTLTTGTTLGPSSITSTGLENGLSLRLPVKAVRADIRALGCQQRMLALLLDSSEPTLLAAALLRLH